MTAAQTLATLVLPFIAARFYTSDEQTVAEYVEEIAALTPGAVGLLAADWAADLRASEDGWISGTGALDRADRIALFQAGLIADDAVGYVEPVDHVEALRALVKVRFNAAASGIDIEDDGGWMVPSADTIRTQIERTP